MNPNPVDEAREGYSQEYYEGTPYGNNDEEPSDHDNIREVGFTVQQVGFVSPPPAPPLADKRQSRSRKCELCRQEFPSQTKYHKHRKTGCPKDSKQPNPAEQLIQPKAQLNPAKQLIQPEAPLNIAEQPIQAKTQLDPSGTQLDPMTQTSPGATEQMEERPIIVAWQAEPSKQQPGYAFKGFQYAKVQACIGSPANDKITMCADSGCGMSLIDRKYLNAFCPRRKSKQCRLC